MLRRGQLAMITENYRHREHIHVAQNWMSENCWYQPTGGHWALDTSGYKVPQTKKQTREIIRYQYLQAAKIQEQKVTYSYSEKVFRARSLLHRIHLQLFALGSDVTLGQVIQSAVRSHPVYPVSRPVDVVPTRKHVLSALSRYLYWPVAIPPVCNLWMWAPIQLSNVTMYR